MAFSEIDRVALYWPGRAIQKLRNERQGGHRRTSKKLPFAEPEILEGHSQPGRASSKSGHVRCTAESGRNPPSPPITGQVTERRSLVSLPARVGG